MASYETGELWECDPCENCVGTVCTIVLANCAFIHVIYSNTCITFKVNP